MKSVGGALSDTGDVFTRDDDPELVEGASMFALKLYEVLLDIAAEGRPLLTATCGSFTQYAYAFVQSDAEILEFERSRQGRRPGRRAR